MWIRLAPNGEHFDFLRLVLITFWLGSVAHPFLQFDANPIEYGPKYSYDNNISEHGVNMSDLELYFPQN